VLNVKIMLGSTREGRAADLVVPWLLRRVEANPSFAAEVLDLREWALPMFSETIHTIGDFHDPTYSQPLIRQWNDILRATDALIIVTPEYNHSVPAVLKNALDSVFFSFALRNKPVGVVGYSGGAVGGARAVEHLAHVLIEAEAVPLRNSVLIPAVHRAFGDTGDINDVGTSHALDIMLEDLEWWADILRDARATSHPPGVFRMKSRQQEQRAAS
jgi:NAD(P)H-dependent FMN reductase